MTATPHSRSRRCAVRNSTVQYGALLHRTAQYRAVQRSMAQYCTYVPAQYCAQCEWGFSNDVCSHNTRDANDHHNCTSDESCRTFCYGIHWIAIL